MAGVGQREGQGVKPVRDSHVQFFLKKKGRATDIWAILACKVAISSWPLPGSQRSMVSQDRFLERRLLDKELDAPFLFMLKAFQLPHKPGLMVP